MKRGQEEGRFQQVFHCSARDKTWGVPLGRRRRDKGLHWLTCFPVLLSWCDPNECMLVLEAGMGYRAGRKKSGRVVIGSDREGDCRKISATELEMKLGQTETQRENKKQHC